MQNDKLVLVKNVSYPELKQVLTGFCKMYNNDNVQAQLRLAKITGQDFAVTFPYDIDFEIFCYFINYLYYPMEVEWSADVTAWATTKSGDIWITEKSANKKAMLFISAEDKEPDNVYLTTQDNIGYKLGFAMEDEMQLLDTPAKTYVQPEINISDLADKEYEEIK